MANNGVDGNSSEFFVTGPDDTGTTQHGDFSDGFLDFRYTIFGKLISGDNVRQAIAATPVTTNTSGEDSQPVTPVTIESMSIITETSDGVLLLTAQPGATGSYTVTVSDGLGGSQTFTVNIGTNPYDPPNPWVEPIDGTDRSTTAGQYAGDIHPAGRIGRWLGRAGRTCRSSADVPRSPAAYVDNSYTGTKPPADTTNPDITVTQNGIAATP